MDAPGADRLDPLPAHFKRERLALQEAGVNHWHQLAALSDADLQRLARSGGALERQLRKLRGQARLVVEVGLQPAEAALLLYAGIADRRGLAEASPQQLALQLGRLERSLLGMAAPRVDARGVQRWIRMAQQRPSRSGN